MAVSGDAVDIYRLIAMRAEETYAGSNEFISGCSWNRNIGAHGKYAYELLVEKGAVSLSAPHDFLESHRVAWVADPEGNPVHIEGPARGKG